MVYKTYKSWCVACPEGEAFPGTEVRSPFHPLLILQPADLQGYLPHHQSERVGP